MQDMKLDGAWFILITTTTDREFTVRTATMRPRSFGQPFTRWSIRKLAGYFATHGTQAGLSGRKLRLTAARWADAAAEGG